MKIGKRGMHTLVAQTSQQLELLHGLTEHVEKVVRQEGGDQQGGWEASSARVLVASYEALQGEAKTLESLMRHLRPIPGWLRRSVARRQQAIDATERSRRASDCSFQPEAPTPEEVSTERLIMKVGTDYIPFRNSSGKRE